MIKPIWHIIAVASLAFFTACERTETALPEDPEAPQQQTEPQQQTKKAPQQETAIKIEVDTSERQQDTPDARTATTAAPDTQVPQTASTRNSAQLQAPSAPFQVRRCMNMGNALEAPNEGDWGYRITAQDLRSVAAAGFDTVRIPIRWDAHTAHRAPYIIDAPFMARVNTVVRDAQSAGLGVIIDVHHYEDLMARPTREQARFLAIWNQIARNFADAPDTVYFEVLNEPTLQLSNAQVNDLYAKVLPVIRATNPTRKVILGGNSWNSIESLDAVRWPQSANKRDANLVATFHDYGPHAFTHQGAEWSEPVLPLGRRWGGPADMDELADTYQQARDFKAKTGLPIFVGEFGVIDKVPMAERFAWTKIRRKTMEAHGFSWCAWDFSGAFKSYDLSTRRWFPGAQDALFGR